MYNRRSFLRVPVFNAVSTIIQDEFTGPDGTALTAHPIAPVNLPSAAWTSIRGTWRITGNRAVLSTDATGAGIICDLGYANCVVSCKAKTSTNDNSASRDAGLQLRETNEQNRWKLGINYAGQKFNLYEVNANVVTLRAQASVVLTNTDFYAIAALLSGTAITATLDGANQIGYASANLNATVTKHGLQAAYAADALDDFKVDK